MRTISFNNGIGSRGRQHRNLLVIPGKGIVQFKGESIPPVAKVVSTTYDKGGKWSKNVWTVEVQDDVLSVSYAQDWGNGECSHLARSHSTPQAVRRGRCHR